MFVLQLCGKIAVALSKKVAKKVRGEHELFELKPLKQETNIESSQIPQRTSIVHLYVFRNRICDAINTE